MNTGLVDAAITEIASIIEADVHGSRTASLPRRFRDDNRKGLVSGIPVTAMPPRAAG
jgi:hypothetical protein